MSNSARIELARDLHDGIAQDLVALGYELDLLLGATESTVESRREIRGLRFKVDELIKTGGSLHVEAEFSILF